MMMRMFSSSSPRSRRLAPRRKRAATPTLGVTALFALCIYSLTFTFTIKLHNEASYYAESRGSKEEAKQMSEETLSNQTHKNRSNKKLVSESPASSFYLEQMVPVPINVNVTHKEQRRPMEYYIGRDKKGNEVLLQDYLSALVDIAYIGHSKCGSSSIQSWFKNHDEIYINKRGREDKVMQNGPLNAVKFAYKSYPNNGKLIS